MLWWFDLGALALKQSGFSESLTYYNNALQAYTHPYNIGEVHHLIAFINDSYLHNPSASLSSYQQAIAHFEKATKDDEWFKVHFNYGNTLSQLNSFVEAIYHYETAIAFIPLLREVSLTEISHVYHNLTVATFQNQQPEKGAAYFQKTKKIYEQLEDKEGLLELIEELNALKE